MLTIETKELKRKVETICGFANVKYTFENGNIISIKKTSIAYVKPHILKVKNNDHLIFEKCDAIFINGYNEKIKVKDLENYIKTNAIT